MQEPSPTIHLYSSFLIVYRIEVCPEKSDLLLLCSCADVSTGCMETIFLRIAPDDLNQLLSEQAEPESARFRHVQDLLNSHIREGNVIKVRELGELTFKTLIFALRLDEQNEVILVPGKNAFPVYILYGYAPRADILPDFQTSSFPPGKDMLRYRLQLLAMTYYLFEQFEKKLGREKALVYSNLTRPLVFSVAKRQYEIFQEEKNRTN